MLIHRLLQNDVNIEEIIFSCLNDRTIVVWRKHLRGPYIFERDKCFKIYRPRAC